MTLGSLNMIPKAERTTGGGGDGLPQNKKLRCFKGLHHKGKTVHQMRENFTKHISDKDLYPKSI